MTASYAVRRVHEQHPTLATDYIRWRLWYSTYVNIERKCLYFQAPKAACTAMTASDRVIDAVNAVASGCNQNL